MKELSIEIREANLDDAKAIAYVHVESWRSSYAGIIADSYLNSLEYKEREAMWVEILSQGPDQESQCFVAVDQGTEEVIGFCSSGPARLKDEQFFAKGEIYALYLLKSYQGLGIGRQLFEAARYHLLSIDLKPFMLWVLEQNPNFRFYQKMQGKAVGKATTSIGDSMLPEVAFAWDV